MTNIQSPRNHKNQLISFHFKKRVQERCGIWISSKTINMIIGQIKKDKLKTVEKQSDAQRKVLIPLKNLNPEYTGEECVILVYDKRRQMLVTVLNVENNNEQAQ